LIIVEDYYIPLFTEITRCKTDRNESKNVSLEFITISVITKYFKSSASTQPLKNREKFCNNRKYFCLSIEFNKNVFALRRRDHSLEVDKLDGQHNVQHYNIQHKDAQNNDINRNGLYFGGHHKLQSAL